jgi:hypothetical protein
MCGLFFCDVCEFGEAFWDGRVCMGSLAGLGRKHERTCMAVYESST